MNVSDPEDIKKTLQKIANDSDSLILSFIAPESAIKKTPSSAVYASIRTVDLYEIEKALIKIDKEIGSLPKKLKFIVHTPGGSTFISTKIAKYLRSKFNDITVYIPYEASSGGTVLSLIANRIVMDEISNLTPIDSQVPFGDTYVSVNSYEQAIEEISSKFKTARPDDLPPPYKVMINKFDPVILQEMKKRAFDNVYVAMTLLETHVKDRDKSLDIAFGLTKTKFSHSHVIDMDEAKEIGLVLDTSQKEKKILDMFKLWVGAHLNDDSETHIINVYRPSKKSSRRGKK